MYELLLFFVAIGAGFLGALLGIGGGLIIVPVLTLALHVDIRYAITASLISVVATSSGAAASFLEDHLTNLRVAVFLEVGTVFGAITGFLIANSIEAQWLYWIFAFFLTFSAYSMLRVREEHRANVDHPMSRRLGFASSYKLRDGRVQPYAVENVWLGLFFMYGAGILSALLGIGSGVLKVLAMDGAMKLPIKVSSATSNFMIGVTAMASAGAYLLKGDIQPQIVAPVAVGIIFGSWAGSKAMLRMSPRILRRVFVVLLTVVAIQMILKGLSL